MSPIPRTILDQLGGNKFLAMTGASSLVYSERKLQFHLPRRKGVPHAFCITLAGNDTYQVRAYRFGRHGLRVTTVGAQDDVYAEMLVPVFERMTGLRCSL